VDGPYQILWSRSAITNESVECSGDITTPCYYVISTGEFPRDSKKISVSFTIPEAAYGHNYVSFKRGWRPEKPYGFSFMVVPDIKVTPAQCSPHSTVTIKGTGFPSKSKDVILSFDGNETKLSISCNDKGSFAAEFTVPDTIAGSHEFKATSESLSFGDITTNLQVVPAISLQPEHPDVGTEVMLSGWGFASRSPVSIKYDDATVSNSPTTGDTGNFTEKFKVPQSSKSDHVIIATDKAGNVATFGLPLESAPPSAPNPISPTEERFGWFGAQPVLFTWSEVPDTSGVTYILEVDKSLRFFPLEPGMRKTGLTKPNAMMTLEPGTYYWRVKAVDGAGNESEWSLSPYPIQVGFFSGIYLAVGACIFIIIFIFIVRAFFRRVREYYK
jgi:hypothetical protein